MDLLTILTQHTQGSELPHYASNDAAGADLKAFLPDAPITLSPNGGRALIPTGLILEIPPGYEGQVRPRSGLAVKHGVTVLNAPGTIDADYRGEVKVILINHGNEEFLIRNGDRIAQLIIAPVIKAQYIPTHSTSRTDRGSGGFGSTGV